MILTRHGQILASGSNNEYQLGIGDTRNTTVFVALKDMEHIKLIDVEAGNRHSAAISNSNELFMWGSGAFGEFKIPHLVKSIKGPCTKVSLGQDFGAAITQKGEIYVWGNSNSGKLGIGDRTTKSIPCKIPYLK